jgi:hypothetical protein
MSPLQIRRSCLLLSPQWLVCRVGQTLPGVLTQSDQLEKTWLWCHSGPTSPGNGSVHSQLLPGLLLWQPSQSMEEAGERCPCFVWQLSQLSVACGKWRQGQQPNMVDLSSSVFGNSKHIASPSYHAPWFYLATDLCATWVCNTPSRTGPSSSHCGTPAFMILGSNPEHTMSENSRHPGRNELTCIPSHLLIWQHLFSSHQGTLTKEMKVGWNCPE